MEGYGRVRGGGVDRGKEEAGMGGILTGPGEVTPGIFFLVPSDTGQLLSLIVQIAI